MKHKKTFLSKSKQNEKIQVKFNIVEKLFCKYKETQKASYQLESQAIRSKIEAGKKRFATLSTKILLKIGNTSDKN